MRKHDSQYFRIGLQLGVGPFKRELSYNEMLRLGPNPVSYLCYVVIYTSKPNIQKVEVGALLQV